MATEGFTGMAELLRGLEQLGETVQQEAAGIVEGSARLMAANVAPQYASRTGTLRDRVVVEKGRIASVGTQALRWKVRNKAPHAWLYEKGSAQRFTAGTGANRGRMPAKATFVPAAIRAREGMRRQLIALVKRQRVPGMSGSMEVRES